MAKRGSRKLFRSVAQGIDAQRMESLSKLLSLELVLGAEKPLRDTVGKIFHVASVLVVCIAGSIDLSGLGNRRTEGAIYLGKVEGRK